MTLCHERLLILYVKIKRKLIMKDYSCDHLRISRNRYIYYIMMIEDYEFPDEFWRKWDWVFFIRFLSDIQKCSINWSRQWWYTGTWYRYIWTTYLIFSIWMFSIRYSEKNVKPQKKKNSLVNSITRMITPDGTVEVLNYLRLELYKRHSMRLSDSSSLTFAV